MVTILAVSVMMSCAPGRETTPTDSIPLGGQIAFAEPEVGLPPAGEPNLDINSTLGSAVGTLEAARSREFPSYPLPDGDPGPLGPSLFRSGGFSEPLPSSPVWNPPGPKRVGIQAGHWETNNVPNELRRLSPGTSAGGWAEWEINLLIARHTARLLQEAGVEVDILPTTIPVRYRAHAFVSVHADGDTSGRLNGFKIARPGFSSIPEADDLFVKTAYDEYASATSLPRDDDAHISRRMLYYYAFNTRRYQHAIDLGTPSIIVETGFLTNAGDRAFLTSQPEGVARGIANGVLRFLELELGSEAPPQ